MASTTTGQSGERNPENIFYYTETRCSMLHMFESYIYQISVFITTTQEAIIIIGASDIQQQKSLPSI